MEYVGLPVVGASSVRLMRKLSAIGPAVRCIALAVAAFLVAPAPSQGQSCKTADDESGFMLTHLKQISSSSEERQLYQRRDFKIPMVDTATIVLVSERRICDNVLATLVAFLPGNWPPPLPSSLYVAKVGNVYVGMVLAVDTTGSVQKYVVVDSKYRLLAKYSL